MFSTGCRVFGTRVARNLCQNPQIRLLILEQLPVTSCTCKYANFQPKVRFLSFSPVRWDAEPETKVEQTLKILKDEIRYQQAREGPVKLVAKREDGEIKKKGLIERVKDEFLHYYHGFRLLFLEIRVSFKYMRWSLTGIKLSRREKKQLIRTASDVFRLVPFSIFVIVPFMEFLLPVALWLFPGMLPSTFQEVSKEHEKTKRQLKVKLEMAKFLQATVEEISLQRQKKALPSSLSQEFTQFMKRIRTQGGGYVSNTDLLKYSKLFEDELTLDNLSQATLRALCRLLAIKPPGFVPEAVLRFQLNLKLRELRADDQQIHADGGVDFLSVSELQAACRARGMRALGLSHERLKSQLRQWLELSLNDQVPPSLLLLSRALYFPEEVIITDRLKTIVQTLPDSIAEQTRQKLAEIEGQKVNHKERLELIQNIEEALKQERLTKKKAEAEEKEKEEREKAEAELVPPPIVDPVYKFVTQADKHVLPEIEEPALPGDERIATEELAAIEDVLHEEAGAFHEEKEELLDLKEAVQEHKEDIEEVKELVFARGEEVRESKAATRLSGKVNQMIDRVDSLLQKLKDERQQLTEELKVEDVDAKQQRLVSVDELVESLRGLQKVKDETKLKRIHEVLEALDEDHDGAIDLDMALQVVQLLGEESLKIQPAQMKKISELLRKEERIKERTSLTDPDKYL